MTESVEQIWAAEIRDWLIGRVGRRPTAGAIQLQSAQMLGDTPALYWWIFEGRRYRGLEAPLARSWDIVERQIRRLRMTYNPRWRLLERPEGEVDWLRTALHQVTSWERGYVSRASRTGLDPEEEQALEGWLEWVSARWAAYTNALGAPEGAPKALPWAPAKCDAAAGRPDPSHVRRWAHTARRSRWPILRNLVAETLRSLLEPQELDRLPLPADRAVLFELLCMVRILRQLSPRPEFVRWVDLEFGANRVRIPGMTYYFQFRLEKDEVLGTREFEGGLREAMERHQVRVPSAIDGWLQFDEPKCGFQGVLIEAKSGTQGFDATLHQLKCYRAALQRKLYGRMVVWGIIEEDRDLDAGSRETRLLRAEVADGSTADTWAFSCVRDIPGVLGALGLAKSTEAVSPDTRSLPDLRVLSTASEGGS